VLGEGSGDLIAEGSDAEIGVSEKWGAGMVERGGRERYKEKYMGGGWVCEEGDMGKGWYRRGLVGRMGG